MFKLFPLIILLSLTLYSQENTSSFEEDIQHAFVNAKKGLYYALNNIPESKISLNQDLIEEDKLNPGKNKDNSDDDELPF